MKRPTNVPGAIWASLVVALLSGLVLAGCEEPPPGGADTSDDPEVVAADVKTAAVRALNEAKAAPQSGASSVEVLVENLQGYGDLSLGEYKDTHSELVSGCEELHKMYQQSAGAEQILAKIDELLALADTLPGDVASAEAEESEAEGQ
jgi:outer membrane murein-binding lipoprotein Lpp